MSIKSFPFGSDTRENGKKLVIRKNHDRHEMCLFGSVKATLDLPLEPRNDEGVLEIR